VYASDVEALRKVYLGIKLFPDFLLLFPERLGLIGFDVTGWTKMAVPEITSIMIPAYQEGRIASQKLIEMIESKNSISNKKIVIKNAVRWRDSTL
jgi:DNA-binding LacI/PurR family transcriptional regulator